MYAISAENTAYNKKNKIKFLGLATVKMSYGIRRMITLQGEFKK